MHGGAEGAEGRSDTVTGWRDTLCEAAKLLQGCARAARVSETTLMWSTISCLVVLPLLPQRSLAPPSSAREQVLLPGRGDGEGRGSRPAS